MKAYAAEECNPGSAKVEEQYPSLPPKWRAFDRAAVQTTELSVFAVAVLFTVMITLEVVSRQVFNFSIFFINAPANLLLLWFFLLGAGLAFRQCPHVALRSPCGPCHGAGDELSC